MPPVRSKAGTLAVIRIVSTVICGRGARFISPFPASEIEHFIEIEQERAAHHDSQFQNCLARAKNLSDHVLDPTRMEGEISMISSLSRQKITAIPGVQHPLLYAEMFPPRRTLAESTRLVVTRMFAQVLVQMLAQIQIELLGLNFSQKYLVT